MQCRSSTKVDRVEAGLCEFDTMAYHNDESPETDPLIQSGSSFKAPPHRLVFIHGLKIVIIYLMNRVTSNSVKREKSLSFFQSDREFIKVICI